MSKTTKFIIISSLLLSACASVPLSSLIRLSTFGSDDFLAIQPEQLRTRLTLKGDAKLSTDNVVLALSFEFANDESKQFDFDLELVDIQTIAIEEGWISDATEHFQYEFRFSPESLETFKANQKALAKFGKPKKYKWKVYYGLLKAPPKNEPLTIDMQIKFADDADFFYLLKNAKVDIEREDS